MVPGRLRRPVLEQLLATKSIWARPLDVVEIRWDIASANRLFHAGLSAAHRGFVVAHQEPPPADPSREVYQRPLRLGLLVQSQPRLVLSQRFQTPVDLSFEEALDAGLDIGGRLVREDREIEVHRVGQIGLDANVPSRAGSMPD